MHGIHNVYNDSLFLCRDEHSLIAQYCQRLNNGDMVTPIPDSPMQVMAEIDAEQRHALEVMIR